MQPRLLPPPSLLFAILAVAVGAIAAAQPACAAALEDSNSLARAVLALADARLALMPDVAAAKWASGRPVADPAREAVVIRAAGERALALGLAREPVEALFEVQIDLARGLQEALQTRWRTGGGAPSGPAPSLANELRPRLDQLTGSLLEALYLAAPTLATIDLPRIASISLPNDRWSDEDRARFVAALAQIRLAAPRSLARAHAAGVLRIGTPADYAPFSVEHDGLLTGSDVDLAADLATALGLRPVYVRTRWATLLEDLEADRYDIAVGGISVTDARRARAGFSTPLLHGGKTAIGRCTDLARLGRWEDIDREGVRVVENVGGTNAAFAQRRLRHATLLTHADNRTVMDELSAGRADVMFTDDTEVALVTHRRPELCRLLPDLYEPTDKAILLPHDAAWSAAVDGWLQGAVRAGLPTALLERQLNE